MSNGWPIVCSVAALILGSACNFTTTAWAQPADEGAKIAEERALFKGVEYIREVVPPSDAVVHIIKVDLSAPGIRVLVTPPDFPNDKLPMRARTTSQFLSEFSVQVAINANFFSPFDDKDPLELLPFMHRRKAILGAAASAGVQYGQPDRYRPMLNVSAENHATIGFSLPQPWYMAVAGIDQFIAHGKPIFKRSAEVAASTTVGTDRTGSVLYLVVADGGDPSTGSGGLNRRSLTFLLLDLGVFDALWLDGGGSSTMAIQGPNGLPHLVNRPVQGGVPIPDLERPVGNHLGIFAQALPHE